VKPQWGQLSMMDELVIEEMSIRAIQEKMDEAFRAAMQRAIDAGKENAATVVSKKPGTRNPKVVLA
jgi:20S proteasome alpha/beta subunit